MPKKKPTVFRQSISVGIISLLITSIACITGFLPDRERKLYDLFLLVQPPELPTDDIVIVGLTENDIAKFRHPVTDKVLGDLINKIDQQNPRVIGLDIHRDIDIGEEGNKELDEIFANNEKLIGVEMTNGGNPLLQSIAPPIQLEAIGRTGASEVINDSDIMIRRAYLYRKKVEEGKQDSYIRGLGLALSLIYLEELNIYPEGIPKECLKLNKTKFRKIKKINFFYPSNDIDNCQILIGYPLHKPSFKQVSFSDVLEDKISPYLMTDKIVLIGSTAPSLKDIYYVPHPLDLSRKFVYGVELHGIITQQIITATLNERKIIAFPSFTLQLLWVAIWFFSINFLLAKFCLQPEAKRPEKNFVLVGISSLIIVLILGYGLFLVGWLIPTATTLSLLIFSQIITYILIRSNKISKENILLEQKVEEKTQALKEAQKIILEQEKFKVHEMVMYHIAHEINNKIHSVHYNLGRAKKNFLKIKSFLQANLDLFETNDSIPKAANRLEEKILNLVEVEKEISEIVETIYQKELGKTYQIKKTVNINHILTKIVDKIVELKKDSIEDFQLEVERNYDKNVVQINCIFPDMERALEKIIENSIYEVVHKNDQENNVDYQPKIILTTISNGNSVLIKIKDNGRGIKPEDLDKIFESFWTTKPVGEGLGLGLHMAKEIIEDHGGSIKVESEVGEWTEFTITLPVERTN